MESKNTTDQSCLSWLIYLCLCVPFIFTTVETFLIVPYFRQILDASFLYISFAFLSHFLWFLVGAMIFNFTNEACTLTYRRRVIRIIVFFALLAFSSMAFYTIPLWPKIIPINSPETLRIIAIIVYGMVNSIRFSYSSYITLLPLSSSIVKGSTFVSALLGAAIGVGLLWLPFDLLHEIHFIFLVINGIGLIFLLLYLLIHHYKRNTIPSDNPSPPTDERPTNTPPSSNPPQSTDEGSTSCLSCLREWRITTWLLVFMYIPIIVFPGDFHIFMTYWYLLAGNPDPSLGSVQDLVYDMNDARPVISYWAAVFFITQAILFVIHLCCSKFSSSGKSSGPSPMVPLAWLTHLLVFGTLTVILFVSGTISLTSEWLILIFIFSGLHLLILWTLGILSRETGRIQKTFSQSEYVIQCQERLSMFISSLFPIGRMASSLLIEYFGYPMLFKIYGSLIAASLLLWSIWPCFISEGTVQFGKKEPVTEKTSAKPIMTFKKKSIKYV